MQYSPRILIADDEPRFCESLRLLLNGQGYQISTTTSGFEAQNLLSNHQFDLALLDLVIPDMDGHQLMEYINRFCPDTLVIVITGKGSCGFGGERIKKRGIRLSEKTIRI